MHAKDLRVTLGAHYQSMYDENSMVVVRVKKLILHPDYNEDDPHVNNIAALQLIPPQNGIPLGSDSSVDAINLPNANQTMSPLLGNDLYYVGWPQIRASGIGNRAEYRSRLQWTDTTVLPDERE